MIIFRIKICLNKLWNYAVNRWPLGRTHTALEECIFLAQQFEDHWGKKISSGRSYSSAGSRGGWRLAADRCREQYEGEESPADVDALSPCFAGG